MFHTTVLNKHYYRISEQKGLPYEILAQRCMGSDVLRIKVNVGELGLNKFCSAYICFGIIAILLADSYSTEFLSTETAPTAQSNIAELGSSK